MSLLADAPTLDSNTAQRLAADLYGLHAAATPLTSERDQNFLLETPEGKRFVLKIANAREDRAMLEAQNAVLAHINRRTGHGAQAVATKAGEMVGEATTATGQRHFVRLLTYIPGIPLGRVRRHAPALMRDLGRAVGEVDVALKDFDHPALHREFHWDLRTGVRTCRQYLPLVGDAELRRTVEQLLADYERRVTPVLARLPTSVIHNDANDYNVIVSTDGDIRSRRTRVAGIVDLGDMVVSYTVADLAVAIAYAVLDKPDSLGTASSVTAGYHAVRALSEDELSALWGLACLRLCLSVCIGAQQVRERPGDDYLSISQQAVRRTLPRLAAIPPRLAEAVLRGACGLEPWRGDAAVVRTWLHANAGQFAPVLGVDLRSAGHVTLDLGVGSPLVSGDNSENTEPKLTERISRAIADAGGTIGIGRYGEARLVYLAPLFDTGAGPNAERRTVHLGIDLFAPAGTPVHAPLDGVVHAFANNDTPLDYGGVIVLSHTTAHGIPFYTLYGHLAAASLAGLAVGQRVEIGARIAALGTPAENGGWTPHLHLQLIMYDLQLGTDFPGVAPASQRAVWQSFSPDPSALLGLTDAPGTVAAPGKAATLAKRRIRLGGNLSVAYDEPLKIERGWMQYLYDDEGRRYLDAYNNVPHVGHSHPLVVRAARDQMAVLNTNTRYLHDLVLEYAERLCATLDPSLRVCWFVNSGSEANELALRLARAYTGSAGTIVLEAAYHGNTSTLIDISPYKHAGPGGSGAPPWVHVVPSPDSYRGRFHRDDPDAGMHYAGDVAAAIAGLGPGASRIGAFIAESCPSVGGQLMLPDGYLRAVYGHVRASGGVCIADEVQTGLGRIGTHFWAFESQGVVPDIVVLGKPLGNGHPIGAVITTPEIADRFDNGMEFFSTFGGNPVSCAVGLSVLDVVRDEGLQAHALHVGERMLLGLGRVAERHALVGDVRGSGLFLGVELVRDRETLEPATAEASHIVNRMREEGVLIGTDGPFHNVLKIRPPMPFGDDDADRLVDTLAGILDGEFAD
jgi:4-aminobutyrate aminotransferase-like enzyme/Ser/Thr protein kinase RdoA (MazF antagonist)